MNLPVLEQVKDLLLKVGNNYNNQTFVKLYYREYDLGMLTPCESITRARRFWTSRAKKAYMNGVRESWVLRLIPSQERLIQTGIIEGNYRDLYSSFQEEGGGGK